MRRRRVIFAAVLVLAAGAVSGAVLAARHGRPVTTTLCTPYTGTHLAGFVLAAERNYPTTECLSATDEAISTTATATITNPAVLDFNGATVSGSRALAGPMIKIAENAGEITVSDVTLTSSGGDGIECRDTCVITDATVEGMAGIGIYIDAASGSQIGDGSVSNAVSTIGNGTGTDVYLAADVTIGHLTSDLDNKYGLFLQQDSACSMTSFTATATGTASTTWNLRTNSDNAAGIELIGTGTASRAGCSIGSVTTTGGGGYGLALGHSSFNSFASVAITGEPQGDLNPGINIDAGAAHNTFAVASVTGETIGVEIGNNGEPGGGGEFGNDDNVFRVLDLTTDTFGGIDIVGGTGNIFTSVTGTDVGGSGPFYAGLITLHTNRAPDTGNIVTSASFSGAPAQSYDVAQYIVFSDRATRGNSVTLASVDPRTYRTASCLDTSGGNTFGGCA